MAAEKLVLKGISKRFGSTRALDGVDFVLRRGEIHALMGENGAGKSTLMKVLIGLCSADSGEIILDGRPTALASPREALARGIAMIHQELHPVPDLTVADNLFLGREISRFRLGPLSLVDADAADRRAGELLAQFGVGVRPNARMRELSVAQTQLVEIIKAVSQGAEIIIMDEPTSAISENEAEQLFSHMLRLKDSGVSIIFISHRMREVFRVSDRVTILRDGCLVTSRAAAELDADAIIRLMVGREIDDIYPKPSASARAGEVVLEVAGLSDAGRFREVSFALRKGEILGMAGLMGSGRTEIAECLFGLTRRVSGLTRIRGRRVEINSPRDAIRLGLALVADDRKLKGLNLEATVGENMSLLSLGGFSRLGVIDGAREKASVGEYMARLGIKAESGEAPVASLSGGNQQKVVLAKWLMAGPEIIIFDEPTRGIDVGAKHDIYLLLRGLAGQGKAVLMISSEMGEIIGLSDRVIVISEGRVAGELNREGLSQEAVMRLAAPAA
jgi:ribose transport system ATP-binding protein/inositol transport system ATP-binding protein